MLKHSVQLLTWDWLGREIVREVATRPYGTRRAKNFARTLAERLKTGPSANRGQKEKSHKEH